jgi:hypothetical protein
VPRGLDITVKRGLFDSLDRREFVAVLSGLEYGEPGDVIT